MGSARAGEAKTEESFAVQRATMLAAVSSLLAEEVAKPRVRLARSIEERHRDT